MDVAGQSETEDMESVVYGGAARRRRGRECKAVAGLKQETTSGRERLVA